MYPLSRASDDEDDTLWVQKEVISHSCVKSIRP